ncbi:MAG TPA: formate dehydrogenase accessory protein FdhE, partial [Terriglobia bacterium]|nr:formate dehydrogenase accessory protein FdhE [Terriglobia bacterium]
RTAAAQPPELSPFERFCAHAFLQPYAEFLADRAEAPTPSVRLSTCPNCASPPLVGVLRPEGEGAKRSLICSLCRTEWDYLRIACPACAEHREEKLSVYTTPMFEAIRVEACGTCRAYIITVDLTQNGLAVPEVDALAAIPLTLWADEKGYQKVTRNILCL